MIWRFKDIIAFTSIVIEFEASFNGKFSFSTHASSIIISTFTFSSMSSSSIGMEILDASFQFSSLFCALFSLFLFASFSLFARIYSNDMTFLPLFIWYFLSPMMLINLRSLQFQRCISSEDNRKYNVYASVFKTLSIFIKNLI